MGTYPKVTLKRARQKRDRLFIKLDDGIDPIDEKRAARFAQANTFGGVAKSWFDAGCPFGKNRELNPVTVAQLQQRYDSYLKPALADRSIIEITVGELRSVLDRIQAAGKHETAHRVRALAERIYLFAIVHDLAERNVAKDLQGALKPRNTKHHPAITDQKEIGALLRAIDSYHGEPTTRLALQLQSYVFVRTGELRLAEWSEIDWQAKEWRIPGNRMKADRAHVVPLSKPAIEVLEELHSINGDSDLIFPQTNYRDKSMSENTTNCALWGLGYKGKHSTHGFRSTARTLLEQIRRGESRRFGDDIIELQLAHKIKDATQAAYNRHDPYKHITARRRMMQHWAEYLDRLKAGKKATVTALRG